ncbi:MAG: MBL fold metallo-hydrolase [Patescibacteria group bacterium]
MKITKYGHCCLLVEENGVIVLTDPGSFSNTQNAVKNIDVVLVTHEHPDHFHVESVKEILKNNPEVLIVTNGSVNELLKKENILNTKIVEGGESFEYKGIMFKGFGVIHEVIYKDWARVQNTGYCIAEKLFIPGDSFEHDDINPEILALPVAGPWMKIETAVDYCIRLMPKKTFPIHDGILSDFGKEVANRVASGILSKQNIEFINLELGKETLF